LDPLLPKASNPPVIAVEPVTIKLPDIIADPVWGKLEPPPPPLPVLTVILNWLESPFVKVIVLRLTEAVVKDWL